MVTLDIFRALRAGEELANATKLKNINGITNALATLVVIVVGIARAYGYTIPFSDDTLVAVITSAVVFMFNAYTTYATSKRVGVGVPPPSIGDDAGVSNPTGTGPVPGGWAEGMDVRS